MFLNIVNLVNALKLHIDRSKYERAEKNLAV